MTKNYTILTRSPNRMENKPVGLYEEELNRSSYSFVIGIPRKQEGTAGTILMTLCVVARLASYFSVAKRGSEWKISNSYYYGGP